MRRLVPVLGAAGLLGPLALVLIALEVALPRASAGDKIAARVVASLELRGGGRGVEVLGGRRVAFSDRRLSARATIVRLQGGRSLLLAGTRIRAWAVRRRPGLLGVAEADLSASPTLVVAELAARLTAGKRVLVGRSSFEGVPDYVLRLTKGSPSAELFVARRSLRALGARFVSRRLAGWSDVELLGRGEPVVSPARAPATRRARPA